VEREWEESKAKIQGAIREDPGKEIESWAKKYPEDQTLILYCSWPNEETSAWVARKLMILGFKKVYVLKGGWNEWFGAKFPIEPK